MEYFDILDRNGHPTGKVAPKGTLLQDGQYYLGVHCYIHNPMGMFLLQQRAIDKAFLPGGWDIHMGHVMAGETSGQGILREIKEEVGLAVPPGSLRFVGRVMWEIYHHMIDVYFVEIRFDMGRLVLQPDEVIATKAVSTEEILALVAQMDYRPAEYRQVVINEIERLRHGVN